MQIKLESDNAYTTKRAFDLAHAAASVAAEEALADKSNPISNGSEAWHGLVAIVDGRSALARELKNLGWEQDPYWGLVLSAPSYNNYYAEDTYAETFSRVMRENGIKVWHRERLL